MLPSWLYHCNNTIVATVLSMIQPWPWFFYCKCPGPIIITVFSMIQSGSLLTVQVNSLSQYFHCNSPDLVIATAQSLPHLFANDTTTVLSFWQCWNPIIDAVSCCYSLTMATILSMSQSSRFFSHVIVTDRQLFKGLQHCLGHIIVTENFVTDSNGWVTNVGFDSVLSCRRLGLAIFCCYERTESAFVISKCEWFLKVQTEASSATRHTHSCLPPTYATRFLQNILKLHSKKVPSKIY